MVACASTMNAVAPTVRGRFITVPRRSGAAPRVVVRATQEAVEEATTSLPAVYFYRGSAYSEEEWRKAKADGTLVQPIPPETYTRSAEDEDGAASLGDLMAFSGAPELINGRLAMLAFVAAVAAELSSGESVLGQWADEPTGVFLTFITFSIATLIPMLTTTKREPFLFFTPNAEMLNGRAAMIGFAALLAVEATRGGAALF